MKIRHAINLSNTTTVLQIGDKELTVDSILIRMPQLQAVKDRLDEMRKNFPNGELGYGGSVSIPFLMC